MCEQLPPRKSRAARYLGLHTMSVVDYKCYHAGDCNIRRCTSQGIEIVAVRRASNIPALVLPADAVPIDGETWRRLTVLLRLPPQQVKIAELVLMARSDHIIARTIGIEHSTLRSHFSRLLARIGAGDRTELVSRLCIAAELLRRGATESSLLMTTQMPNLSHPSKAISSSI
ncbi:MAG: hypothetical protein JWM57_3511 [Phycisphaerales bacterium]|nr:hypothetical protein [Phycisphaerales bacterium]